MYKLVFFVPVTHLEPVKHAVFAAGAGRQGDYDQCCWQTLGYGQFRPLEGAKPYVGTHNTLETVPEYRVELLCSETDIKDVLRALKRAHPYEEPAFDVIPLANIVL
jgi:structural toxin protein (hemagglutinin/hemolysin) RtxA